MDIGKAIKELIKEEIVRSLKNGTCNKEETDNVINFLQRGWKYEEMWEELENITSAIEWEMVDLEEIKLRHLKGV